MPFEELLKSMGLPGLVIFGLGWFAYQRISQDAREKDELRAANSSLVDKIFSISERTAEAMHTLARQIEAIKRGDE